MYYDSRDYKAYWDKIEGHRFRRKVRIRTYGQTFVTPETEVFVEIKQRIDKTLQKKRLLLPYQAALDLCGGRDLDELNITPEDRPLAEEIHYLSKTLDLRPVCVITYNRLAFNGTYYDSGLRITFDNQLKSRVHDLSLLSPDTSQNNYFAPHTWTVMEVKVNNRVPYWATQLLSKYNCTLRRVGKYCTALQNGKDLRYQRRTTELGIRN